MTLTSRSHPGDLHYIKPLTFGEIEKRKSIGTYTQIKGKAKPKCILTLFYPEKVSNSIQRVCEYHSLCASEKKRLFQDWANTRLSLTISIFLISNLDSNWNISLKCISSITMYLKYKPSLSRSFHLFLGISPQKNVLDALRKLLIEMLPMSTQWVPKQMFSYKAHYFIKKKMAIQCYMYVYFNVMLFDYRIFHNRSLKIISQEVLVDDPLYLYSQCSCLRSIWHF